MDHRHILLPEKFLALLFVHEKCRLRLNIQDAP